jgi:hypothetical protein
MKLRELSLADVMAKYVEKSSLHTNSNYDSDLSIGSYATYDYGTPQKSLNWRLIIIAILIVFGLLFWVLKANGESIKKWLIKRLTIEEAKKELPPATDS